MKIERKQEQTPWVSEEPRPRVTSLRVPPLSPFRWASSGPCAHVGVRGGVNWGLCGALRLLKDSQSRAGHLHRAGDWFLCWEGAGTWCNSVRSARRAAHGTRAAAGGAAPSAGMLPSVTRRSFLLPPVSPLSLPPLRWWPRGEEANPDGPVTATTARGPPGSSRGGFGCVCEQSIPLGCCFGGKGRQVSSERT